MNNLKRYKSFGYFLMVMTFSVSAVAAGEIREGAVVVFEGESHAGRLEDLARRALQGHAHAAPTERMAWAGLGASGVLAMGVVVGRVFRLRRGRVIPRKFVVKCLDRLCAVVIDRDEAIDYCELNPSPASRIALGAIRRWGRGVADVERGAALVRQVEVAALRRHVGTLRRIAGLSPLIGLLGTLSAAGRVLAASPSLTSSTVGPALAVALGPLTAGVALAILALVAYDGISGKVESLEGDLERLISRTVDAIASADDTRTSRARSDTAGPFPSPHASSRPILGISSDDGPSKRGQAPRSTSEPVPFC
jgi:biopolymer transport protein ExbB